MLHLAGIAARGSILTLVRTRQRRLTMRRTFVAVGQRNASAGLTADRVPHMAASAMKREAGPMDCSLISSDFA